MVYKIGRQLANKEIELTWFYYNPQQYSCAGFYKHFAFSTMMLFSSVLDSQADFVFSTPCVAVRFFVPLDP